MKGLGIKWPSKSQKLEGAVLIPPHQPRPLTGREILTTNPGNRSSCEGNMGHDEKSWVKLRSWRTGGHY